MNSSLTICSVSYNSAGFLRLNAALTKALNPGFSVHWIVAENSPAQSINRLGSDDREVFELLEGIGPGHAPTYHHTLALKKCTSLAKSRFVAVIDPDLFVLRPNWADEIIKHMQLQKLGLLGVPWHPQSSGKYRYFPAVHFTVFDTERFRLEDIDFLPDFADGEGNPDRTSGVTPDGDYFVRSPIARMLAQLPFMKDRRQFYTDTGSRLFKRWVDDKSMARETLVPRWRGATRRPGLRRWIDALMPDELDFEPRNYPPASFRNPPTLPESALAMPPQWESFEWRGELFCFHVRGNLKRDSRSAASELDIATRIARLASDHVNWS